MRKVIILLGILLSVMACNKEEKSTPEQLKEDDLFRQIEQNTALKNTDLIAGSLMPNFTLKDIEGKDFKSTDFKGQYLLLDFWTYWCPPCKKENKHLVKYVSQYPDLKVISIHEDANTDKWKSEVKKQGLESLTLLDDSSRLVGNLFGVEAYPVQFLVDDKGVIVEVQKGGGVTFIADKLKQIFGK